MYEFDSWTDTLQGGNPTSRGSLYPSLPPSFNHFMKSVEEEKESKEAKRKAAEDDIGTLFSSSSWLSLLASLTLHWLVG